LFEKESDLESKSVYTCLFEKDSDLEIRLIRTMCFMRNMTTPYQHI
jgi:hypothetical protein